MMKGIILAGGSGTRLLPMTKTVSKQLLNVYDKPMIYYPIVTLMQVGIKDILIITKPEDKKNFQNLLGNGSKWGIKFSYLIQKKPNGIAEAFILSKKFIGKDQVCLILGDNIFYGSGFNSLIQFDKNNFSGAKIVSYKVTDPENYGVINYKKQRITSISEKPKKPKSNEIVTGLYFYDNSVTELVYKLKPSKRQELEISDLNNLYLNKNRLEVLKMKTGMVWLDLGSFDSLLKASQYVSIIQERQNIQIGCPEETAFINKWINTKQFLKLVYNSPKNSYGNYLRGIAKEI